MRSPETRQRGRRTHPARRSSSVVRLEASPVACSGVSDDLRIDLDAEYSAPERENRRAVALAAPDVEYAHAGPHQSSRSRTRTGAEPRSRARPATSPRPGRSARSSARVRSLPANPVLQCDALPNSRLSTSTCSPGPSGSRSARQAMPGLQPCQHPRGVGGARAEESAHSTRPRDSPTTAPRRPRCPVDSACSAATAARQSSPRQLPRSALDTSPSATAETTAADAASTSPSRRPARTTPARQERERGSRNEVAVEKHRSHNRDQQRQDERPERPRSQPDDEFARPDAQSSSAPMAASARPSPAAPETSANPCATVSGDGA